MSYLESEQILEDLCFSNGLNYAEFRSSQLKINDNVKYLEMFFNGFPYILHMDKFPNLTELKIIAQELSTISGLETCLNLSELWIAECKLNKISGLKNCRNLKKLFLYSNKLTKIENLDDLNLEVLWLSDNKISVIEGIDHMTELTELNLAKNLIYSIGKSLISLKNLEILNLASNLIDNFEEITNLQNLPNLKHLCFKDAQYGQNPVTILCNYSLFVIYHLPGLISLDTLIISQKIVKELADSTINKKKLWYFMKLNSLNREYDEMIEKIDSIKRKNALQYLNQISNLVCKIKDIEKEIFLLSSKNEPNENEIKEKQILIKPIEDKIKDIELNIQFIEGQYKKCLETIIQDIEFRKNLIFMELENGGNIRFEFSNSKTEGWYKSCYDLIMSRFCSLDYVSKSINGIKIKRIIRVINRVLVAKYEERLLADVDENDYINNKPSVRKKIEYLLYCWKNRLGSNKEELYNIIKNGFNDPSVYKKSGYDEAIHFTNSLFISDSNRIENSKGSQSSRLNNNMPYKYGYALLCKVYTNKFSDYKNGPISIENYSEHFGVKKIQNDSTKNTNSQPETNDSKKCDCKSKQTEWFLLNKNLALPEYIVEFEYLNKYNTESIFEKELTNLELKKNEVLFTLQNGDSDEETSSNQEFDIEKAVSKEINIQTGADSGCLIELNLHNIGLTSLDIEPLKNAKQLKKLIISFNKLTNFKEINYMTSLEYLDVSYNQIKYLSGIKNITKLYHLDLSNNELSEIISLSNTLRQNFPILIYLDLSNNWFKKNDKLRLLLLYSLRSLQFYNKQKINDNERNFSDSRTKINKEIILKNSNSINSKPRCLRYSFVTELFKDKNSSFNFNNLNYNDDLNSNMGSEIDLRKDYQNPFEMLTVLSIENQGLYKLSNIDYLTNLKYASFNNNFITKIEGLDKCTRLEELSLENNLIQSLNGLENLENLRKLNLNNNEIVYYDDLNNKHEFKNWELSLNRLAYLSIANNLLTSIKFVIKLPALIEFYASLNQIKNLREIFNLKSLNSLSILDLCSNPMCSDSKYRIFVIYHIKNLKSLDGNPIESSELTEARESFGGKLTCDFIAEKFTHTKLSDIRSLEFPQCSIRVVDLGPTPQMVAEQFESLRSLNLENNNLTSFSGLIYLKNLKILCLNNNKIESLFPKQKGSNYHHSSLTNNNDTILPNLEVLHLAFNGITDLVHFQMCRLSSLKALFLQGNEITKIEGIDTLRDLRELVLDKNKIKTIGEFSFIGQSHRLLELHMEENRLRDLNNIQLVKNLQKLYVANNKINDYSDIDRVLDLHNLYEISMINNPISRRPHYRITMVYRIKRLKALDMMEVNEDDRIKAEIYFSEQQQLQQQPQIYYNGMIQSAATQIQNQTSINQLEHQFISLSQSPRLKPITLLDKQLITNPQISNNNNGSGNSNKKLKNPLEKLNKEYQNRYRN